MTARAWFKLAASGNSAVSHHGFVMTASKTGRALFVRVEAPAKHTKQAPTTSHRDGGRAALCGKLMAVVPCFAKPHVEQLILTLKEAHEAGIVHRDVQPANVMFDGTTGNVVLLDRGFSCGVGNAPVVQDSVFCASPKVRDAWCKRHAVGEHPLGAVTANFTAGDDVYAAALTCVLLMNQCLVSQLGKAAGALCAEGAFASCWGPLAGSHPAFAALLELLDALQTKATLATTDYDAVITALQGLPVLSGAMVRVSLPCAVRCGCEL